MSLTLFNRPGLACQIIALLLTNRLNNCVTLFPDLINVPKFTAPGFQLEKMYAKKCVNFIKIDIAKHAIISKVYTKIHKFIKIPQK